MIEGVTSVSAIESSLETAISNYKHAELEHALSFISQNGFAKINDDEVTLQIEVSDDLREYCEDLIDYGLTRYNADYSDSTDFKLWRNYRMDQVQLKLLKPPGYTQLGTYVYDKDVIIFASLKKDLSDTDRLNYKDKFLQADLF